MQFGLGFCPDLNNSLLIVKKALTGSQLVNKQLGEEKVSFLNYRLVCFIFNDVSHICLIKFFESVSQTATG